MATRLKIMKLSGMVDRINTKIELLKSTLESERVTTEIEILSQHRDRLLIAINSLRAEIGVC